MIVAMKLTTEREYTFFFVHIVSANIQKDYMLTFSATKINIKIDTNAEEDKK